MTEFATMPDGRKLSYAIWGDPDGAPLIYFHGTPGSRINGGTFHTAAANAGIRLICPERPGFGKSDPLPRRELSEWAQDVAALADHLGLDTFPVAGASGGGPHALSCAAGIPERLTHCSVIAGAGPFDRPEATAGMDPVLRWFWRAGPLARRLYIRLLAFVARWAPEGMLIPTRDDHARPFYEQEEVRKNMVADMRESLRDWGAAMIVEVDMLLRPWDVDLRSIDFPIRLWHGEDDRNCPVEMGKNVASLLPNCDATFYPGEGHLCGFEHLDEFLAPFRQRTPVSSPTDARAFPGDVR